MEKLEQYLQRLLDDIQDQNGFAAVERFAGLRDVDAKVREARMVLEGTSRVPPSLVGSMRDDPDFQANSRRVRLEALANYLKTALKFLETGVLEQVEKVHPAPDVTKLTSSVPGLDASISNRWLEAQRCQQAGAYLAAVVMMGSILEALLLARAFMGLAIACQAKSAPKDRAGKVKAVQDWNLSSLVDVAVELGWLKFDRGKFSHALRESRNVVHPWVELTSKVSFDEPTCRVSWEVLVASVDDLLASV